jgi:hypothetical protein
MTVTLHPSSPEKRTFWLSFATEDGFLGVAIIDLTPDEIGDDDWIGPAVVKARSLGANPGGHVQGSEIPQEDYIPEGFKHRLLNEHDIHRLKSLSRFEQRRTRKNAPFRA